MKLGALFRYEIQTAVWVRNTDRYLDTKYRPLFGYEIWIVIRVRYKECYLGTK